MKTTLILPEHLDEAVALIKQGEPVAFPTETVYGLGASAFQPEAIAKVFAIKGRPSDNPLIVHIHALEEAQLLSNDLSPLFFELAERFWPGPLTLIVKRKETVPSIVSAGHPTIAIRMPIHALARKLIAKVGEPLAAPSANLSGRPSPTSARDVLEDLEGRVAAVLDGGMCSIGIESTVLNLTSSIPTLLRPGAIHKEELEEALHQEIALPPSDGPILSPGMKYRHYAPKAKIRLIFSPEESRGPYLLKELHTRNLYAALRRADRMGMEEVEVLCDEAIQKDEGMMNRLMRAAGHL